MEEDGGWAAGRYQELKRAGGALAFGLTSGANCKLPRFA